MTARRWVFLGIGLIMLYAGGLSHWLVGGVLTAGVVGGGALLLLKPDLLKGYQFQRIMAILTPEDPALSDITYQQNKGAMAIGTGGLTGQGTVQRGPYLCPQRLERLYLCVSGQCAGVCGRRRRADSVVRPVSAHPAHGIAQSGCAGALYLRGDLCGAVRAVRHQPGHEPAGIAVIGVTLPFFSAGGSSVVMMYFCVGLVLSVGIHARSNRLDAGPIL